VIEQDFLPGVDLIGLDTVLVAQARHRHLIDKMDGCLLTRTETSSWRISLNSPSLGRDSNPNN